MRDHELIEHLHALLTAHLQVGAQEPDPPPTIRCDPDERSFKLALDRAIDAARGAPEVVLLLPPGDYVGRFDFGRHDAPGTITVTSDPAGLPAPGQRMTPAREGQLPRFISADGQTPVTVSGDRYVLRGLDVVAPKVGYSHIEVGAANGDAILDPALLPTDITFDQMLLRGSVTTGGHRGIGMNGRNVRVSNSYIDRMWEVGRDAQALAAWNTTGPLHVENNYLEASGENFMLGGSRASIGDVPTDVVFTRNHVRKDLAWRTFVKAPQVKNLFELKFARRVRVADNLFEHNWGAAQTGWSILITTKSNSTPAAQPWCVIEDVDFHRNVIRHVSSGINLIGLDGPCRRVRVTHNVWDDLNRVEYLGDGRFILIGTKGLEDVDVLHNTVLGGTGTAFGAMDGTTTTKARNLRITHNLLFESSYGLHSSLGIGQAALDALVDGVRELRDNAILDSSVRKIGWPGNTLLPVGTDLRASFDAAYALIAGSLVAQVPTSDGAPIGADDVRAALTADRRGVS